MTVSPRAMCHILKHMKHDFFLVTCSLSLSLRVLLNILVFVKLCNAVPLFRVDANSQGLTCEPSCSAVFAGR
jgi:hypothetical protein